MGPFWCETLLAYYPFAGVARPVAGLKTCTTQYSFGLANPVRFRPARPSYFSQITTPKQIDAIQEQFLQFGKKSLH
jgi:hypothetical protein